jgi:hypothetical protein
MNENPSSGPQARSRGILIAVIAFLGGVVIGLPILGWWLWPVQWTDIPQPPTYTPYPTPIIYPSPTSGPDAYVMSNVLNLYESPGYGYAVIGQVNPKDSLIVIGQYANCGWLKVTTPSQLTGWVDGSGSNILQLKPCETIPQGTYRPLTGILKSPANPGEGQLTIDNKNFSDVVIILVDQINPTETITAAYIRSGETFTIGGIPNGTYTMYYASGNEWNSGIQHFTVNEILLKQNDPLEFAAVYPQYDIWTVTFNPFLQGGNTDLVNVLPMIFPEINK